MNRRVLTSLFLILLPTLCARAQCEEQPAVVQEFLNANISGYAQYISAGEFSELRLMQDTLMYCEKNGEEAISKEITAQYEEKCLAIKGLADAQFSERIADARRKLGILEKSANVDHLHTELSRLEHAFSSMHIIPPESKVLRDIERQYSSAIARQTSGSKKTYTVQEGDCLVSIAEAQYGTYKKWRELYEANRDALPVPENPALIYPGLVLIIQQQTD